ncbi:MAG TPA: sulfite exporter TauE/SafE family protein [Solirubrobacteraceae bacterium]|nr:sulfite exporter TauE/SafE family protein [Solirubrobacteraceae bacterium]
MTVVETLAVLAAGALAGGINTVIGSGSLITFPTLLAVGFAPVTANVTNTVGLVPGSASGVVGYRRELRGHWRRCAILGMGTTAGAVLGGVLLLELPDAVFDAVVPALILLAVALMALPKPPREVGATTDHTGWGVAASFSTGIYGGYFGAAQGIILISLLRLCFSEDLQVLNAIKNVLAGLANLVAGVLFIVVADVAWDAALLIAAGSVVGAQIGAHYGRRLPQEALRRAVIVYGAAVAVVLIVT